MPSSTTNRAVRIAGCSGGFTDRQRAIHDMALNGNVDVIIGDWMSECTMTLHGAAKIHEKERLAKDPHAVAGPGFFDPCFMGSLAPGLPVLQQNNVKLAVNAGASDPELLVREVKKKIDELGLKLKVAWIEGDEVTPQFNELRKNGEKFTNLDTGKNIDEWDYDPMCAQ
jgi:4-hydroxy-3-methylbut-2-enyl diphosphate reductase IspH